MNFNRQGALLVAVMLTALVAVICGPVQRFLPDLRLGYLIAAVFLVALEAALVHHTFRREHMWTSELARYLVPELFVMLILMRIAATLITGTETLAQDAQRWLFDPLSIFDTIFLVTIVVGLFVGATTHIAMQDLVELAPKEFDRPDTAEETRVATAMAEERAEAMGRIGGRFVWGGALVLLCLALEAVNIEQLAGESLPISGLSTFGALTYLVSGFLLYSQARLALLQSRWQLDGTPVGSGVLRRWTTTSWLIIGGVAGLALLLPRTYGMGLLDTLRSALGVFGYAFVIAGYAIVWFFSLLLLIPAWLLSLFSTQGDQVPPVSLQPDIAPPPPPPEVIREPQLLPALVFWLAMLLLAGYALWIVAQRHPGVWRAVTQFGPLVRVLRWLGVAWNDTRGWASYAAQTVRERLARTVAEEDMPARRQWLRRLAPRELIRYLYRSTLRRAAARGVPRRADQTPYEYSATLAQHLPEAQADINELTESFVVAEYSPRDVDATEARRIRRPWARLRRRLRRDG